MRASLYADPVSAGVEQRTRISNKKDHRLAAWFWDHKIGFCQRHYERDRQHHIAECLTREAHAAEPSRSRYLNP
jgi:hypothetical protein